MFRFLSLAFILVAISSSAQDKATPPSKITKGKYYFYWGWNRGSYTNSDIHFKGTNYNFTLNNVVASDKQSKFNLNTYLNPIYATIPQFDARFGYNISEHYSVSLGDDHMKYKVVQDQTVKISGEIAVANYPKYNGQYASSDIQLTDDFLKMEHCDGLNYLNIEFRRYDELFNLKKIKAGDISITLNEGIGIGAMMPRTKAALLTNMPRHEFHFAGYATSAVIGLNIQFWKHFFIQGELKGGYINMPSIFTTMDDADRASQHFFFLQKMVLMGWAFTL